MGHVFPNSQLDIYSGSQAILICGVAVWWTALHKQCILTPVNKVQRMVALYISGVFRDTPNER